VIRIENFSKIYSSKAGYPQPKDEVLGMSYQLSALEVILKFEDFGRLEEVFHSYAQICINIFQDIIDMLLLKN